MFTHIYRLFFNNLLLLSIVLSSVRAEALLVATVACITTLFVKWLVCISSSVFLLNDEVRRAAQVDLSNAFSLSFHFLLSELIGILTDVVKEFAPGEILLGPLGDVIVRFLLLEAF